MTEDQKQRAIKALEWMITDFDRRNEDSIELAEAKSLLAELKGK